MSVNRYQPHVLVLPEDDANRQLAEGFHQEIPYPLIRRMQVLPEVGGWIEVLERFKSDHVSELDKHPNRFMVLLIDFDGKDNRLSQAKAVVPDRLTDRVFVLGVWTTPEALTADLGSCETVIGSALAKDCRDGTDKTWGRDLLKHNATEIDRLRQRVRPILFQ